MPRVSVVVTTFNESALLREALRTVQQQSFTDFECLVHDDDSPDETEAVVNEFVQNDRRFRYFRGTHSGGPAAGRNWAVENARGEFLGFLDGDDLWNLQKLEILVNYFVAHPEVSVIYHDGVCFDHHDPARQRAYRSFDPVNGDVFPFIYDAMIGVPSALVRRECFSQFGRFKPQSYLTTCEDYDFLIRVAPYKKFAHVAEPLLFVRKNKGRHRSSGAVHGIIAYLRVIEPFDKEHPEIAQRYADYRKRVYKHAYFSLGRAYLWERDADKAKAALRRSLEFGLSPSVLAWYIAASVPGGKDIANLIRDKIQAFRVPDPLQ
jgi:glycosyltransferase involved in cell wall biosynthesis